MLQHLKDKMFIEKKFDSFLENFLSTTCSKYQSENGRLIESVAYRGIGLFQIRNVQSN